MTEPGQCKRQVNDDHDADPVVYVLLLVLVPGPIKQGDRSVPFAVSACDVGAPSWHVHPLPGVREPPPTTKRTHVGLAAEIIYMLTIGNNHRGGIRSRQVDEDQHGPSPLGRRPQPLPGGSDPHEHEDTCGHEGARWSPVSPVSPVSPS